MGDRGNIYLKYEGSETGIYLYTHWHGTVLPGILQKGIRRCLDAGRQTDCQYASRIIFEAMIEDAYDKATGYGMSPYLCDNEHKILCVDFEKQEVQILPTPPWDVGGEYRAQVERPLASYSFTDFVTLKQEDMPY